MGLGRWMEIDTYEPSESKLALHKWYILACSLLRLIIEVNNQVLGSIDYNLPLHALNQKVINVSRLFVIV